MTNYPNVIRVFIDLLDLHQDVVGGKEEDDDEDEVKQNYKCKENPPGSGNFKCPDTQESGGEESKENLRKLDDSKWTIYPKVSNDVDQRVLNHVPDNVMRMMYVQGTKFNPNLREEKGKTGSMQGLTAHGKDGPEIWYHKITGGKYATDEGIYREALHEVGHSLQYPYKVDGKWKKLPMWEKISEDELLNDIKKSGYTNEKYKGLHIDTSNSDEAWASLFENFVNPRTHMKLKVSFPEVHKKLTEVLGKSDYDIDVPEKVAAIFKVTAEKGWNLKSKDLDNLGLTNNQFEEVVDLIEPRVEGKPDSFVGNTEWGSYDGRMNDIINMFKVVPESEKIRKRTEEAILETNANMRRAGVSDEEQKSLYRYKAFNYADFNRYLRTGDVIADDTDFVERNIKNIDNAMKKSPLVDGITTYRYISSSFARDKVLPNLGKTMKEPGYMSTSYYEPVAKNAADGKGAYMTMHVPKGVGAVDMDSITTGDMMEYEVLLERGLTMKIKDHKKLDNGMDWFDVDILQSQKQNYKCPENPPGSGNFKCDLPEDESKKKYTKEDLKFETGGDAVGSEYHGYIRAIDKKTGKQVGYVDYSYYGGEWAIDMIETDKDHKRQGVATALIDRMKDDFSEGDELTMQGNFATDEGKAFMSAKGIGKNPTHHLNLASWTLEMFKDPDEPRYSEDDQDLVLKSLVEEIGFDELPKQVDSEELDNRIKDGDTEIFRAFSDYNAFNDFMDGDYYAGQGVHGNGIYTAKGPDAVYMANTYMRSPDAVVGRMTVDKGANIVPISKVREEFKKFEKDNPDEASILEDVGRFATYLGYDAVDVGGDNLVVLNRGVIHVAPVPVSFDESRKEESRRRKTKSKGDVKQDQSVLVDIEDELKKVIGSDDVRLRGIRVDDARVILETLREESEFMPLKLKGIRTATGRKKAYMSMTQDGVLGISPTHVKKQADREVGTYDGKIAEYDNAISSLQEQASNTHDLSVKGKVEALISQYEDERDQLESDRDAGTPFLPKNVGYLFDGDDRIKTVLLHEVGHMRWNGLSNEDKNAVNIAFKAADEDSDFPSRWSMERSDEWWAEQYALFRMGADYHPIIDSVMRAVIAFK